MNKKTKIIIGIIFVIVCICILIYIIVKNNVPYTEIRDTYIDLGNATYNDVTYNETNSELANDTIELDL